MYAVWILFISNLKKKKLQNGLIALLIMLSTLLVSTAFIIILNTENLFTDVHNKTNGSHQILRLQNDLHDPEMVHDFWSKETGVTVSKLLPYKVLSSVSYKGEEIPNLLLYIMDTPKNPLIVDELLPAQGNKGSTPELGTVWIPTSLAYSNTIAVGDTLTFQKDNGTMDMKVSAVVVDVPYGGPFSTEARIWMNDQDYQDQLASTESNDSKEMYMIGLRYDDYSQSQSHWKNFEQALGTPYLESLLGFNEISSFYLIINKVIGFVMIFLGIVMMFIALFTIGFTISDAILSNYRTIGVLKSLGLSSWKTVSIYLTQYSFLSIISIIPGLILSSVLSGIIVNSTLSYLKTDTGQITIEATNIALLVGLLILALVVLCVLFYGNKARNVQPVQAIRYGMSETDSTKVAKRLSASGSHMFGFENFPATFVIGIRNILKNIKGSLLMLVLGMVTAAVLVFGYLVLNSITNIQQTSPMWGYDNSNISVRVDNKEALYKSDFKNNLASDPRIKSVDWYSGITGVIEDGDSLTSDKTKVDSMSIIIDVVEGSYDNIGFAVLSGHNPTNKNEISIGANVAKTLNKQLGDVVELYIKGKKHTLTVTSIYQAISNASNSVRVKSDVVTTDDPDFKVMDVGYINLNDSSQADQLVSELNTTYKNSINAATQKTLLDSVFKEAASTLLFPMSLMGLLFMVVTLIIIYSICLINIRKESKTYGIYKSVGMTSSRIRMSVALGVAALSALGALIGAFMGVYILPLILESILADYGIIDLPLVLNWGGIIIMASLSIISATIGSWLSSSIIRKNSPRILVVE